jgi:hypothetical protein
MMSHSIQPRARRMSGGYGTSISGEIGGPDAPWENAGRLRESMLISVIGPSIDEARRT